MTIRLTLARAAVLAGAAAPLVFAGSPASAQVGPITVQGIAPSYIRIERVPYWDLNLATRAGAQALHLRVSHAVERVCLYDRGSWYGLSQPDYNQCTWGAWRGARPQMASAIYRARQFGYYRG